MDEESNFLSVYLTTQALECLGASSPRPQQLEPTALCTSAVCHSKSVSLGPDTLCAPALTAGVCGQTAQTPECPGQAGLKRSADHLHSTPRLSAHSTGKRPSPSCCGCKAWGLLAQGSIQQNQQCVGQSGAIHAGMECSDEPGPGRQRSEIHPSGITAKGAGPTASRALPCCLQCQAASCQVPPALCLYSSRVST